MKMMSDPVFLAEAEKRGWKVKPVSGEKFEALAQDVVAQPPKVITRTNVVLER